MFDWLDFHLTGWSLPYPELRLCSRRHDAYPNRRACSIREVIRLKRFHLLTERIAAAWFFVLFPAILQQPQTIQRILGGLFLRLLLFATLALSVNLAINLHLRRKLFGVIRTCFMDDNVVRNFANHL